MKEWGRESEGREKAPVLPGCGLAGSPLSRHSLCRWNRHTCSCVFPDCPSHRSLIHLIDEPCCSQSASIPSLRCVPLRLRAPHTAILPATPRINMIVPLTRGSLASVNTRVSSAAASRKRCRVPEHPATTSSPLSSRRRQHRGRALPCPFKQPTDEVPSRAFPR